MEDPDFRMSSDDEQGEDTNNRDRDLDGNDSRRVRPRRSNRKGSFRDQVELSRENIVLKKVHLQE